MTTTNLDQISAEITKLMVATVKNEEAIQPLVLKIWTAFDEAKANSTKISIEGATNKTAWTKLEGKPKMRYCQYLVRDGSRKRGANDNTHPVRVTVNLDKATHVIFGGETFEIDRKLEHKNLIELGVKHVAKKEKVEERKPIKHAKFNSFSTWCSKDAAHSNMARAKTQATCPFCLAALAAGIQVENPVSERRRIEAKLRDARKTLQRHEETIANCLPEHQHQYRYKTAVESIPEERAEVAELEKKLAGARLIETPEQAVEAAKATQTMREAERARLAALPRHILHPQPPKGEELTLCGETIVQDETQVTWSQQTPATCPACIEQSKQIGMGVTQTTSKKSFVTITHIYGGATAGGGQFTRMHSYALCGRNFTPRSEDGVTTVPASGRIHRSVLRGETPNCEKCLELGAKRDADKIRPAADALSNTLESTEPLVLPDEKAEGQAC